MTEARTEKQSTFTVDFLILDNKFKYTYAYSINITVLLPKLGENILIISRMRTDTMTTT